MLRRLLIADATARAAALIETGFKPEAGQEHRLRGAFVEALASAPDVLEVQWSPEWRPVVPGWPKANGGQPGGFDLAVKFAGDESLVELKWTHYGFINALDEVALRCTLLLYEAAVGLEAAAGAKDVVAHPRGVADVEHEPAVALRDEPYARLGEACFHSHSRSVFSCAAPPHGALDIATPHSDVREGVRPIKLKPRVRAGGSGGRSR